jgi:hypothetical protein
VSTSWLATAVAAGSMKPPRVDGSNDEQTLVPHASAVQVLDPVSPAWAIISRCRVGGGLGPLGDLELGQDAGEIVWCPLLRAIVRGFTGRLRTGGRPRRPASAPLARSRSLSDGTHTRHGSRRHSSRVRGVDQAS